MYPYQNPNMIAKALMTLKNIKWGTFLEGTQKTLGVINQAIPIVYQVKPLIANTKTLFKIVNGVSGEETPSNNQTISNSTTSNNSPIFYL